MLLNHDLSLLQDDYDTSVANLANAAQYFAKAWELAPSNVSAMNGMANIYLFARDYDRAIQLGMLIFKESPSYGSAIWDLSLALEGKISEVGPEPESVNALKVVYQYLEQLMLQQPQAFSSYHLAHVQRRLAALE